MDYQGIRTLSETKDMFQSVKEALTEHEEKFRDNVELEDLAMYMTLLWYVRHEGIDQADINIIELLYTRTLGIELYGDLIVDLFLRFKVKYFDSIGKYDTYEELLEANNEEINQRVKETTK